MRKMERRLRQVREVFSCKTFAHTMEVCMAAQDENWRRCNKCQGLFYTGNPTFGTCPTGGGHDYSGSANYSLTYNDPSQPQQPPYVPSPPAGQGLPSYGQPPYGVAPVSDPIAHQATRK